MDRSVLASVAIWFATMTSGAVAATAPSERVLYSFSGIGTFADGAAPLGGLVQGPDGSLYGTTSEGGGSDCNCGTVFKLTPPATGQTGWTETVIHSFQGYPSDGSSPYSSLVFDAAGNLYGTTLLGGSASSGTVFILQPAATGQTTWTETVLHNFAGTPADGQFPYSNLAIDAEGNLYGTASLGGDANQGIAYRLGLPTDGGSEWTVSLLHEFQGGADGGQPYSAVVFDPEGNLYGTTSSDGITDISGGTVFQLALSDGGATETVLHTFTARDIGTPFDGGFPYGNLTLDAAGNIYGTTEIGGGGQVIPGEASNAGTVFRLAKPPAGQSLWTETLIHSFNGTTSDPSTTDGATPAGGLLFDSAGNLYGTTLQGGTNDDGTVFMLTPPPVGQATWNQTILHTFSSFPDGAGPSGTLVRNAAGALFGTTQSGTTSATSEQVGTVYRLFP
jgi:uncharacterized repeat protein (TIGR03803 family)